jgi:hypothetical protein
MKKIKKAVLILIGILAGCASTADNLLQETARSIGANPADVAVSRIERGMTTVKWTAVAPTGKYDCSADDMVRKVLCVKQN